MSITLPPLAEIKAKALAALNAGTLQCQQPDFRPYRSPCLYTGPCAIGIALSPEDAQHLDQGVNCCSSIAQLLSHGVVRLNPSDPRETKGILNEIQGAHDRADLNTLRNLLET